MHHHDSSSRWRARVVVIATTTTLACAAAAAEGADSAAPAPAPAPAQQLAPVQIHGNYLNAIGSADAASAGTVTATLIESRATLRPAEILEFVPGVIVTQHSGEGKANQYFLRGFNLDHGTDFATFVDGMPVNMPSHAHGQGYSDLNWLIPELVDRLRYRKGPYRAEDGDFASAGSARIDLVDRVPDDLASLTLGQDRYARALVAGSSALGAGRLSAAFEAAHDDGPWDHKEKFHRANAMLRYAFGGDRDRSTITAMGYAAGWNATDQIPRRALASGALDRFGAVDPSDGGRSDRFSISYQTLRRFDDGELRVNAYAIRSSLNLFSNFTFFLAHPSDLDPATIDGDQFEQAERRQVYGLAASRSWSIRLGAVDTVNTLGVQLRHDRVDPLGLYATVARRRAAVTQESAVRETSVALYGENAAQWTPWLRSVAGVRADRFGFDVASSIAANSGTRHDAVVSPKLSLVLGPWQQSEAFVNYGEGFHSNDARGTTATVAAGSGAPVASVTPLVRSRGSELGVRSEIVPGLQSSLALWQLRLGSELVFVGDAGETEPSRASRRRGIEWNNHYRATPWLLLDADVSISRARFSDPDPAGDRIPGSIERVVSLGATVAELGPWSAQIQLRHFGPRPLTEDDSVRSQATTLVSLRLGYRITARVKVALDVFNVFDRRASDIDYFYRSRLKGEPAAGVEDVHFHPVEPRRVRLTLSSSF